MARNLFLPLALTIAFALIDELLRLAHGDAACSASTRCGATSARRSGACRALVSRALDRDRRRPTRRSLGWVLRHRALTVGVILAVFGGSLFLKRFIGTEFFPDSDESQFAVNFKTPDRHARRADRAGRPEDRGRGQPDA